MVQQSRRVRKFVPLDVVLPPEQVDPDISKF